MKREGQSRFKGIRTSLFSSRRGRIILTAMAVLTSATLLTGYTHWPRSPVQLVQGSNMARSGLRASWEKGDVVVLVRHGERCDRSSNECLGPDDGITHNGSVVSADVGQSLNELGLAQTDVITSPMTRTVQTAQSMFGHPVQAQGWLYDCDETMLEQVMVHKSAKRNLILVTHSGCISQLESLHGYPHAGTSAYDSALFISLDARGQPVIRGIVNPEDWKQLAQPNTR
ncbi:histidine phosphatase family protein [Pseudomonas syringae]|uniref:lipopolysaccharide core heptose(II)-phosphate phosphatase PmrG n=1 Tax=Pseudomonas syringae TaxID=317 RepID=UPI0004631DB3